MITINNRNTRWNILIEWYNLAHTIDESGFIYLSVITRISIFNLIRWYYVIRGRNEQTNKPRPKTAKSLDKNPCWTLPSIVQITVDCRWPCCLYDHWGSFCWLANTGGIKEWLPHWLTQIIVITKSPTGKVEIYCLLATGDMKGQWILKQQGIVIKMTNE